MKRFLNKIEKSPLLEIKYRAWEGYNVALPYCFFAARMRKLNVNLC